MPVYLNSNALKVRDSFGRFKSIDVITDENIGTEVTKWMNSNISGSDTVVIDKSLNTEGAAADAKSAGDMIKTIQSYLPSDTVSVNLAECTLKNNRIIPGTSSQNPYKWSNENTTDYISRFVPVTNYDYVIVKAKDDKVAGVSFLKSVPENIEPLTMPDYADGQMGTTIIQAGATETLFIPSDANYMYVICKNGNNENTPDFIKLSGTTKAADSQIVTKHLKDFSISELDYTLSETGWMIDYATGEEVNFNKNGRYTNFIDITGLKTIYYSRRYNKSTYNAGCAFYDENYVFIPDSGIQQVNEKSTNYFNIESVIVPAGAKYFRATAFNDDSFGKFYIGKDYPLNNECNASRIATKLDNIAWIPYKMLIQRTGTESLYTQSTPINFYSTDFIPCNPYDIFEYTGSVSDSADLIDNVPRKFLIYIIEYDETMKILNRLEMDSSGLDKKRVSDKTKFVRFSFGKDNSAESMTKDICVQNFSMNVYPFKSENIPSLNILFIGNSKAYDSIMYVPAILKSLGVKANITLGIMYHGGQGLKEHYNAFTGNEPNWVNLLESTNMTPWRVAIGATNVTTEGNDNDQYGASGLDCFTFRKWDIISFQTATTSVGQYTNAEQSYKKYINGIIEYINDNVNYKWKMAWNSVSANLWDNEEAANHYGESDVHAQGLANYNTLINDLEAMLKEFPVEVVFPVATAMQNARGTALATLTKVVNGETVQVKELFCHDGKHTHEGIGCQLESYTVVIKLLELLGIHNISILNDNTVIDKAFQNYWNIQGPHSNMDGVGSTITGRGPIGSDAVTENDSTGKTNRRIAQKCAILACKYPMEVSSIPTVMPAGYPNAESNS